MRLFKIILVLLFSFSLFGHLGATPCELSDLLDALAQKKQSDPKEREPILKSLLQNPLFNRDDEKAILAKLELLSFPAHKESIEKQLIEFATQRNQPEQSVLRERRAQALLAILKSPHMNLSKEQASAVQSNLLIDLPETVAAKTLDADALSLVDWIKRLKMLSDKNENQLVLKEFSLRFNELKKNSLLSCEVRYLIGRAYRKNRNYQEAMEYLNGVAEQCSGAEKRDALFMLTRLAAIVPRAENMNYFSRFEREYKSHSYYDDVLIFKSSALESLNKKEDAKKTLREITTMKSDSDMRFEAYFRLAFMYALEGDSAQAVKLLDESLAHQHAAQMTVSERHRALYWSARLKLFNDISNLNVEEANVSESPVASVFQQLLAAQPKTIYSWLSSGILKKSLFEKNSAISSQAVVDVSFSSPIWDNVVCLLKAGKNNDAQRFLENLNPQEFQSSNRVAIAQKLKEFGLHGESFRFASAGSVVGVSLEGFLYPKPYEDTVEKAVQGVGIPKNLLYGLMREESRFDARVVSWAGARGLLQLMPEVALVEAKKINLPSLSEEEMLDPMTNILLAAQHLKGMQGQLSHPLLMVAAYNAGVARVKKWHQEFGAKTALDTFIEMIPLPETRNYVKRVAASWINYSGIYSEPDAFLSEFKKASRI